MSVDKTAIEQILKNHSFSDFKWLSPKDDIIVGQWVRLKCMFGCPSYNEKASCPPNTPSVEECRSFFREYSHGIIIHIPGKLANPEQRGKWCLAINNKLVKAEREIFLLGNRKTFALFMDECNICEDCAGVRGECREKKLSRPSVEAMSVDVYETARRQGYPIEVLKDYADTMNRYAILLVE
jgi:predicted metal-binding protein